MSCCLLIVKMPDEASDVVDEDSEHFFNVHFDCAACLAPFRVLGSHPSHVHTMFLHVSRFLTLGGWLCWGFLLLTLYWGGGGSSHAAVLYRLSLSQQLWD